MSGAVFCYRRSALAQGLNTRARSTYCQLVGADFLPRLTRIENGAAAYTMSDSEVASGDELRELIDAVVRPAVAAAAAELRQQRDGSQSLRDSLESAVGGVLESAPPSDEVSQLRAELETARRERDAAVKRADELAAALASERKARIADGLVAREKQKRFEFEVCSMRAIASNVIAEFDKFRAATSPDAAAPGV